MTEMIDYEALDRDKGAHARAFQGAEPFRWLIVDNFLHPAWAQRLHDEFGEVILRSRKNRDAPKKHRHVLRKVGIANIEMMNEVHRQFFEAILEPRFMRLLEEITGVKPLYPDPALNGGGLHEIYRGGYLNVHTDFNFHPETGKHRRLNLLYYLNPDWEDAWEGHLELWPEDLSKPFARIAPLMNRMAIFETSEISFHGHPIPLNLPEEQSRRSLATYYYADWPEGLEQRAKTNYRLVPWQVESLRRQIAELRAQGLADDAVVEHLSLKFQITDVTKVMRGMPAPNQVGA